MSYKIVFPKSYGPDYLFVMRVDSLEEARVRRVASGDLVVDAKTNEIVQDETWLWDWEKAKPDCFARRMMKMNYRARLRQHEVLPGMLMNRVG